MKREVEGVVGGGRAGRGSVLAQKGGLRRRAVGGSTLH